MKRKFAIAGIVLGAILALGPLWGMVGAAFGMDHTFTVLGESGVSDPRALSSSISAILFVETLALVACPVGIALCIFSIVQLRANPSHPPALTPPAQGPSDFKA
jgi:MotA/TolQ/ExbB proton channel family